MKRNLSEKLVKVESCFYDLTFYILDQDGWKKILHENAINKQMDRNNHRTENFPLLKHRKKRKGKSQVSNFPRTAEISRRESL